MILCVGNEKGGVAKTRIATHIACIAASKGVDVVLLDTDPQGSASSWCSIRSKKGISPEIVCLALPPKPKSPSATLNGGPIKELQSLASKYDLVVIDIGAQNYQTMLECALVSDLVLVPCGPDQQEVESTMTTMMAMKDLNVRHEKGRVPAHVVLTRTSTKENAKVTSELMKLFRDYGLPVFTTHLPNREVWKTSGKTGKAVTELTGKDGSVKAKEEALALWEEIVKVGLEEANSKQ